jgi:ribonucleoside-diphosphate reductase beta chain
MAAKGNWNDVWSSFDARRKAKGEVSGANDAALDEGAEPDMFGVAGGAQAAE